ncbi:hypothetical protein [Paucibacter soli]|uniref:hypothetical protein n=1 Tax=Paucibacter soli TaxID=3133433 RepID=UPI0030A42581
MPPILLLVPALELLGLLGFIHLASTSVEPSLRYLPLVAAAITVVLLFTREAGSMTLRQLAVSAALLSLLVVAAFQGLGFVFPGLAKDVDPISFANVVRLAVILAIAIAAHGGALAVCHYLRRRRR